MASGKVPILSAGRDRILFMPNDCGHPFDQAIRNYHHALRRIQHRRARSVANWLMIPRRLITGLLTTVGSGYRPNGSGFGTPLTKQNLKPQVSGVGAKENPDVAITD